jgi:predicted AlkP superfamily pyrophosphatase or phosphodiesterase
LDDAIRASSATAIDTVFDTVRRSRKTTLLAAHSKGVSGLPVDRFADHTVVVDSELDADLYVLVPEIVRAHLPAFGFVHLTDVDEAGHAWGPYSQEVRDAASEMDRRLDALLLDLAEHGYAVVVLADHGLHEVPEGAPDGEGHLGVHDGSVEEDLSVPLMWGSPREIMALSRP